MNAKRCFERLKEVGVLSFATVDESGAPQVRCISAIHYEQDYFYFFTARGKEFCRQLLTDGRVQIMAYTPFYEMIRVSGKAYPVAEEEQSIKRDIIFQEQKSLSAVYPEKTREIGIIFEVREMQIEYFNLAVDPIYRQNYVLGEGKLLLKGYRITDSCIGCGSCQPVCPQRCIVKGTPYRIQQEHCLHCGNCAAYCPVQAIVKREEE